MLRRAKLIVPIFILCLQPMAAELPTAKPEALGFSAVQLELLDDHFSRYLEEGKLAGLTTLVSRKGQIVHFETYGMQNIEAAQAMQPDTIFRIYSMTKPVTGVAMMILWEEGKFKLNDPVSKYLPEFKNGRVYVETNEDGSISTEPAKRSLI